MKRYRGQSVIEGLRYIANSPGRDLGGFHPEVVKTAKAALRLIRQLRQEALYARMAADGWRRRWAKKMEG